MVTDKQLVEETKPTLVQPKSLPAFVQYSPPLWAHFPLTGVLCLSPDTLFTPVSYGKIKVW